MTPNAATPDTLLLGIWSANHHAAATAALRNWQGETIADVLELTGQPWTVLVQALTEAARIDVGNVVILTNDAGLVRALSPPFRPPAPTQRQRIFYSRTEWVDVGWGGDVEQWRALQLLGGTWGGRFRAMQVDDLPKARELWEQSQH
jgi:hypothetical protein